MGEFEKKLLTIKDYSGYFDIIQKEMRSGEILFADKEDSVTTLAEEMLGNQEKWKTDTGNFVYPIFTSFSANKSDRYMARTFTIAAHKIADVPGASTTVSGSMTASGSASGSTAGMILNSFALDTKHTMTIDDREKIRSLLYEMNIPTGKHEQLIYVE